MAVLTVYFDEPWWVGVIEVEDGGSLRAVRHVFGAEPSDPEILRFIRERFVDHLDRPVTGVVVEATRPRARNPKRAAREAARAVSTTGISSKSQEALRLELEKRKQECQVTSRQQREEIRTYKRRKAKERALAKRRGR